MKLPSYSKHDKLLQIVVLPIVIGSVNWILIGEAYWQHANTFWLATLLTLAVSFENWLVNNYISLKLDQRFPGLEYYMRRAAWRYILCTISSCLHYLVLFAIYRYLPLPHFVADPIRLGFTLLFIVLIVLVVVFVYEGIHNFNHWAESRQEVDTLSKAQLQAQLDALRQQVNPHFLFNSLNSLISLISEDPRQAEIFAEELSTVYRYLLRSNEGPLTPLINELEFIRSYYQLLKTRYGDALRLEINIVPEAEVRQLPPLTLQLLIENAVKHNIILPDQPLTISLMSDAHHRLIISNNLQRKPSRALSNGVGLSNILTKYEMLGQPAPSVEDDGQEFRVVLSLV
ncbi:sensor histidine kinase [Salmonirosea aquatica]|uniref:Sensor protein lytS n=1 Tax=Salmonirosea aquatica TaxID=2654236 RepID=A0A7C9BGC5_9BACT|nr:sensor protein lytS [Cytophagaceae bacterium SJW1-29]